jgi:hypothetical protein
MPDTPATVDGSDNPFKRVRVNHITIPTTTGTLITWELKGTFLPKTPVSYYVDFGRPGEDEWQVLNALPIIDQQLFVDCTQHRWSHLIQHFYRIRAVVERADGSGCDTYKSTPQVASGDLGKKEWLVARKIICKELLLQDKRSGTPALLMSRKRRGLKCRVCASIDTGEIADPDCTQCWGTGIAGGYFPANDYIITLDGPWNRRFRRNETTGAGKNDGKVVRQVRVPFTLYPKTGDIIVRKDNDDRFVVQNVQVIAEIRGVPLIGVLELRLVVGTDLIYSIPVEGTVVSSASSEGEAVCDSTAGLSDTFTDW